MSSIIEHGLAKSRRDTWVDGKGEEHLIEEMNPHHLVAAVARLRRTLAREKYTVGRHGESDKTVNFHDYIARREGRATIDELLSARVPAFDAMLKRLEEPFVQQFLLEGPHRHFEPKPIRKRNLWDEVQKRTKVWAIDIDSRMGEGT